MFIRRAFIVIDNEPLPELRVDFTIEKSLVGYPNLANIKVVNLKDSNRNLLEEKGLSLELYAGYEDTAVTLTFSGDLINVVHLKQGPDWYSEIFARDGGNVLDDSVINKAFPAGMTMKNIADELFKEMGDVKKGLLDGLTDCITGKRSLLRAWQASGNIRAIWDELANNCGFEWSINDGVFETTPKNLPVDDVPPVVINQLSGMIGSPERTDIGVNVKNHMLPELKLGRTFKVESVSEKINAGNLFFKDIPPIRNQGVYRIDKLIHAGDTRGNKWETDISGRCFND